MTAHELTIWCDRTFDEPAWTLLQAGTRGHRLISSRSAPSTPVDGALRGPALRDAGVAFGQPAVAELMTAPRLRWIHLTSAGYTRYDRDEVRQALQSRGAILTTSSRVYDEPCAQHVLAMMLALARQLPQSYETQRSDRGWPGGERRAHSYLLNGQTVLLLGFGAIGRRLAQLLAPLGMRIIAARRTIAGDEEVEVVTEAELDGVLPVADHVVNVLPDNLSTIGFVNAARLARMKPGARLYNVGRGTTVDQEALAEALRAGQIGAAYLDVTDPEPLPAEHALWSVPNCYITPHSAGGHAGEDEHLVRHFLANLEAFAAGHTLIDRVI